MNQNTLAKISLLPLLLFVSLFLGIGLYLESQGVDYAFYQTPAPIIIMPAIFIALLFAVKWHQNTLDQAIGTFIKGVGDSNIMTMCMIYLLAGAFATVAKATGGVDAVVNAGLSIVPPSMIIPGIFVIAALIATAMGTSMGTIGAVAPIAYAVAQTTDINLALVAGAVLSGAMFGDNLSFISDTTIASTRTQNADIKKKFLENIKFALPAAALTLLYLAFQTIPNQSITAEDYDLILILPYLAIFGFAIAGVNVFIVLLIGIFSAAAIGIWQYDYSLSALVSDSYEGFSSMQEIFLLSMMIGGLSELIKRQGGLHYVSEKIQRHLAKISHIGGSKASQFAIGFLAFFSNLCIANNTVSIVVSGGIAKELADDSNTKPERSASLLDIFACIAQGLVPFGAQALLLGTIFKISPVDVVSNSIYVMVLAITSIAFILLTRAKNAV
ncbi:Na+/H+ antiporter NhaC family protein [Catenovulum sp. SM1970]|uniref:Na+/H+ antiporter NhaC family protein n=1 Tax=Marinifaba aquimaris TaxID=2741323 RepID=UPI0015739704|nr:Na+/H+ antiporter NhaC family protein [Marinifaba aquimaris]